MHLGGPEAIDEKKKPQELIDSEVDEYLRSRILMVPSSLPVVTSHFPSLWKETEVMFMVCASRWLNYRFAHFNAWATETEKINRGGGSACDFVNVNFLVDCRSQQAFAKRRNMSEISTGREEVGYSGEIARRFTCQSRNKA